MISSINPEALKTLASDFEYKRLCLLVKQYTEYSLEIQKAVESYSIPLFKNYGFVNLETGENLEHPDDSYLSDQDDLFSEYLVELHTKHINYGFDMTGFEIGVCPALVADHCKSNYESAMLDYVKMYTGLTCHTLEDRKELLEFCMSLDSLN